MFKTASFVIKHQYTNITYAREEQINKIKDLQAWMLVQCRVCQFLSERINVFSLIQEYSNSLVFEEMTARSSRNIEPSVPIGF